MKHYLIAGAGAIGIAIGASLHSQGMKVSFLAHKNTKKAIETEGIHRLGLFGEIHVPSNQVNVVESLDEIAPGSIDQVLVCTKTLANEDVAKNLSEHKEIFSEKISIAILQNGWGNDVPFLNYFSKDEIFQARVITGFARVAPNTSNITVHTAPILFGSLYGCDIACLEETANAINASGIPSATTDNVAAALWAKMLYNTTLNPLGAILNVPYGKLGEAPSSRAIMNRLICETFAVMQACGYETYWKTPEEYQAEFYSKLLPDTYAHRSSTLQDIEKKVHTEINTLNGCIVRLADEHNISVPTHQMICELILAIEANF